MSIRHLFWQMTNKNILRRLQQNVTHLSRDKNGSGPADDNSTRINQNSKIVIMLILSSLASGKFPNCFLWRKQGDLNAISAICNIRLMRSQNWFGAAQMANLLHHMASLGHTELIRWNPDSPIDCKLPTAEWKHHTENRELSWYQLCRH